MHIGGIPVDNQSGGDCLAEINTALFIPVHHAHTHLHLAQLLRQKAGDAPGPDHHDIAGMVPENAQRPEEVLQFLGLGGNADAISRAQHIVTIGNNDLFPAADGADQHLDLQGGGDIFEGHAIQQAALRNVVFHQLHPALGEGFHLGDRRKAQDTGDITGSLPLRVDRKRKPHLLLHESQLTFVFHAAHPGNGILGAQLFGGHAGDHIDLILAGSGNDEIRLTGPGLLLHSISGAIALDAGRDAPPGPGRPFRFRQLRSS